MMIIPVIVSISTTSVLAATSITIAMAVSIIRKAILSHTRAKTIVSATGVPLAIFLVIVRIEASLNALLAQPLPFLGCSFCPLASGGGGMLLAPLLCSPSQSNDFAVQWYGNLSGRLHDKGAYAH